MLGFYGGSQNRLIGSQNGLIGCEYNCSIRNPISNQSDYTSIININSDSNIEPAKATGSMDSPLYVWMYVCMYVRNELISETAQPIFLKLGMKLGDNKGKKIAQPDF